MERLKQEFIQICRLVFQRNLTSGNGGNISVIIPGTQRILIKRSGGCLGTVGEEDCLVIDLDGQVIEGEGRPSMEVNFHLGIYGLRPDVGAVIHAHPPLTIAFSNTEAKVPLATSTAQMLLGEVPNVPYAHEGSPELANLVVNAFMPPHITAISMSNHGAVAVGRSLQDAFNRLDILEASAQVALAMRQLSHRHLPT